MSFFLLEKKAYRDLCTDFNSVACFELKVSDNQTIKEI